MNHTQERTIQHSHPELRAPRRTGQLRSRAARLALRLCQAAVTLSLMAYISPTAPRPLVMEQREAHVRLLRNCGTKNACLRKAPARKGSAARTDAGDVRTGAPSTTRRWSPDEFDILTVWIAPGDSVPLWRPVNRMMVRDAFHTWMHAGAPVRFQFVADSELADIHVVWTDSLVNLRAGQATTFADSHGWLQAGLIEMSTRNVGLGAQDSLTIRAVAMHEVGHLLGLEHSSDDRDVMAPWVVTDSLTRRDRAALRRLYAKPGDATP